MFDVIRGQAYVDACPGFASQRTSGVGENENADDSQPSLTLFLIIRPSPTAAISHGAETT
jgi:hypothetical protein